MLPRLTRRVFVDLAIWMVAFGLLVGLCFPPFALLLGVPSDLAFSLVFMTSCIAAGAIVGGASCYLTRSVMLPKLSLLADRMTSVNSRIQDATFSGDLPDCTSDTCALPVDSEDLLGDCARTFNDLVESLARSFEAEHSLRTFNNTLSRHLEFDALCNEALDLLMQHTGACAGAVVVDQSGELITVASHAFPDAVNLPANDHVRETVRRGVQSLVTLPEEMRIDGIVAMLRPSQVLVLPIDHNEVAFGAVVLASTEHFSPEVRRRTELLRQSLGLALNNARTHDQLQRIAALDPLTELYNRRFGEARLLEEFERAQRDDASLAVLMFDIDHFKAVNDTYGHIAGDKVLHRVARTIRRSFRKGDVLIRYGGEEFLAILPGANEQDATEIAERLRRSVKDLEIRDKDSVIRITISLGVASSDQTSVELPAELVDCADQALYKAKETGRDRTIQYTRVRRQAA